MAIGDVSVVVGVSSTHLARRFKQLIGVTPKRLARTYRFAATMFSIDPAGPIDWADLAGGAGVQVRLAVAEDEGVDVLGAHSPQGSGCPGHRHPDRACLGIRQIGQAGAWRTGSTNRWPR